MKKNNDCGNEILHDPQKPKKNKFKGLTFSAGLLNILLSILIIAVLVFLMLEIYPTLMDKNSAAIIVGIIIYPVLFLLAAVCVLGAIFYMILGIMMVVSSFKDDNLYGKRRGVVITTIVIDFILTVFLCFIAFALNPIVIWFFIMALATLLSAILKIVDLKLYKKRTLQDKGEPETPKKDKKDVDFSSLNEKINDKQSQIEKIKSLKQSNLITDEEEKNMLKKLEEKE